MKNIKSSIFWPLIELIVGIVISIIFNLIMSEPDISYILLGMSILLAMSSYFIINQINDKIQESNELYSAMLVKFKSCLIKSSAAAFLF